MSIFAFIFFLFSLQVICLIVGKKSTQQMSNNDDYFLAGKGIGFFPLLMTFLATQIGGGIVLGATEEAYRYGWSVLLYPLGASLGLLFLGMGVGRKLSQFNVSTIAQIFEVVYGSVRLKQLASFLSIISLFMILVAQIIASNKFMTSIGVTHPVIFIGFWSLVIFYTAMGGLKAVVATDMIQAAFFILVFIAAVIFIGKETPVEMLLAVNQESFSFESGKLCGWLLMPLLFMVIEQDMGQRCFAAESPRTVSAATLLAALGTFLIGLIPVSLGVLANRLGITNPEGGSILMAVITQMTSPVFTALVACAILAALISTSDSLINAISSNLSQDFGFSLMRNLRSSQVISTLIALSAIAFSYYFNNIVDLLIQSYELSVSCLFVPILIAIFKPKGKAFSASIAIAGGALGFCLFRLFPPLVPKEILSIGLSFSGFVAGELLIKLMEKKFFLKRELM
ncbi:MAG: sodium:solute symporter family protein [Parachlamydiaceae bacterium]